MPSVSIARSLRVALIGLTLALALVAAFGVASLYNARQRYERTLARSATLATAVANLSTAAIAEEEVLRDARGSSARTAQLEAMRTYRQVADRAQVLARDDAQSGRLLSAQLSAQGRARALADHGGLTIASAQDGPLARARSLAAALQERQQRRQTAARARARSDSRRALLWVAIAALLALLGALVLIGLIVGSMRDPLAELVSATRKLAGGERQHRVEPSGPRELRELGGAFNSMAERLTSAQAQIEDERRRLAVTIESLGDALIVTAEDSSTITATNPRAAELVPDLPVGSSTKRPGSPLPALERALGRETIVRHANRELAVTAARIGSPDGGVVWTVRDASERARLERAKSDFVAMASHELRSPLTSIKGFVELLAHSPQGMSERQREFVDIILRSTDRLVELVNDLLDVARIEADRVEINRIPIDLGEAVHEVAELIGPRIQEKRQQLGLHVAAALPPALADPGRVRQILANLLTNAHLYTPEEGLIHVGVQADRAWIQIVVEDSGSGMTAEETDHIFEWFYRGRAGGRSIPGTGLGLSIVKSLVELHEGRIEVDSDPGRGTRFRVLLPCAVRADP